MERQGKRLLVIGGGAAGMSAASAARRLQPEMDIVVLERSPNVSFILCGLPYFIADVVKDQESLIVYTPEYFQTERNIEVRTGREAKRIDAGARTVEFIDTATRERGVIDYDRLVVAAGAQPIVPGIPGLALSGVFALRSLENGAAIKDFIARRPVRQAAIIGAGYIGLEMAEALQTAGARVTMIEAGDSVLPGSEPEIAALIEEELRRNGVDLHKQQLALSLESSAGAAVERVKTDGGDVEAEMVLIAAGARPDPAIAREAGVAVGETGGIVTDEMMRTNIPDVYAAGDCVESRHLLTGRPIFLPLGTTANKQGHVAGENAAGGRAAFPGILASLGFKLFDLEVARTGLSHDQAKGAGFAPVSATVSFPSRSAVLSGQRDAHDQARCRQARRPAARRADGRKRRGGEADRRRRDRVAGEDDARRPLEPGPDVRATLRKRHRGHSTGGAGAPAKSARRRIRPAATWLAGRICRTSRRSRELPKFFLSAIPTSPREHYTDAQESVIPHRLPLTPSGDVTAGAGRGQGHDRVLAKAIDSARLSKEGTQGGRCRTWRRRSGARRLRRRRRRVDDEHAYPSKGRLKPAAPSSTASTPTRATSTSRKALRTTGAPASSTASCSTSTRRLKT